MAYKMSLEPVKKVIQHVAIKQSEGLININNSVVFFLKGFQ